MATKDGQGAQRPQERPSAEKKIEARRAGWVGQPRHDTYHRHQTIKMNPLWSGAARAAEWFLNKCYEEGDVETLEFIRKQVNDDDAWKDGTWTTLKWGIARWRRDFIALLFQHTIYDGQDIDYIMRALKREEREGDGWLYDLCLEIQGMLTESDIAECRKKHPHRRSARLAAK